MRIWSGYSALMGWQLRICLHHKSQVPRCGGRLLTSNNLREREWYWGEIRRWRSVFNIDGVRFLVDGSFFFFLLFISPRRNLIVAFLDPLCCADKSVPYSELIPAVISSDEAHNVRTHECLQTADRPLKPCTLGRNNMFSQHNPASLPTRHTTNT